MAKSLFEKGADFLSALVFMFASTNLVVELGILLVVLMGWQFAAAEFVGGPIMIVLLVVVGSLVLSKPLVESARRRVRAAAEGAAHDEHATDVGTGEAELQGPALEGADPVQGGLGRRLFLHDGRPDHAAQRAGHRVCVAGFLTVLVPMHLWSDLFLRGHGFWTSLENASVGPPLAFISVECSIGNVPMAAALWHGQIAFGGIIAFIFADLISLPLVLIYRPLYGTRLAVRLFCSGRSCPPPGSSSRSCSPPLDSSPPDTRTRWWRPASSGTTRPS